MTISPDNQKFSALVTKGGIMFFTIERDLRLYQGAIMLSPVKDRERKRSVYIKEYKYKNMLQ